MPSRRTVLAAVSLTLAGSAGCLGDSIPTGDDASGGTTSSHETDASEGTGTNDEATDGATTNDEATSQFRVAVTDDGGEVELFTGADVATVGEIEPARTGGGYRMPVTLTEEGTEAFAAGLEDVGALDDPDSHRVRTYFEGERLYEARIGAGLADAIASGEWDGKFLFHVSDRETAEEVRTALQKRAATRTTA